MIGSKFILRCAAVWGLIGLMQANARWSGIVGGGLGLVVMGAVALAEPDSIRLWPGVAPGDTVVTEAEKDTTKPGDALVGGRPVIRLGHVYEPTITVFRPPAERDTGAAVLVFPGGGYHILAMDLEGTEVVEWLNSIGVTGVLLKYRVPARPGRARHAAALQDAQRALGWVRHRAPELGLDPGRIGVLGFSAGAHLAAALASNGSGRDYEVMDAADGVSCRPDFVLLIYPGYLASREDGWRVPSECEVTDKSPPFFLVQTQDDGVPVEGAVYYYLALKAAGIPAELHLYPTGGHGYGLRPSSHAVTSWPQRAEDWLRGLGVLKGS